MGPDIDMKFHQEVMEIVSYGNKLKMKFFRTLKDKITTKASRFPKFLTNSFGRFRNSRKGVKPLNRPVRYKATSQTVTMRPPHTNMSEN